MEGKTKHRIPKSLIVMQPKLDWVILVHYTVKTGGLMIFHLYIYKFGFTIYICIPTKPKLVDIIVLIIGN